MKAITSQQTAVFLRQFSSMLTAGVPMPRCFDILEKSSTSIKLRTALYKIKKQVTAGHSLTQAITLTSAWLDNFSRQLIQLGEKTGKLDLMLTALADYYEKKSALQRKIKQILFYPCLLSITSIALTLCMFIFVIPSFDAIFQETQTTLPWLTRSIFCLARALNQNLILIFICFLISSYALWHYHTRNKLKFILFRLLSYLPRIHACIITLALLHFTRNLGIALNAGIPILSALHDAADMGGHHEIISAIRQTRTQVSTGISLHAAMSSHAIFSNLILQMIKVGEESGSLDKLLIQTANLLEAQLEADITLLIQLLEPLIMVVQGALIGGLVIGMYLPVFNLGSAL